MKSLLKLFNEVVSLFGNEKNIQLEEKVYLKYQDILKLLKSREYIRVMNASSLSGTSYLVVKNCDFDDFKQWLKGQIKETKKLKRRDWIIAIISGCIGAAVGLIPWIVSLFV